MAPWITSSLNSGVHALVFTSFVGGKECVTIAGDAIIQHFNNIISNKRCHLHDLFLRQGVIFDDVKLISRVV